MPNPPFLSPIRTLSTTTPGARFLALRALAGRVVGVTTQRVFVWSAEQELPLREIDHFTTVTSGQTITTPLGDLRMAAVAPQLDHVAIAKTGGSKLSGNFSALMVHRLTDAGLEPRAEDDVPAATGVRFSPDGARLAFYSLNSAAGIFRTDLGAARRTPALPQHGETLGERLAAEAAAPKAKITAIGCANDALYVFETQRAIRVEAEGAAPPTEWAIKAIESCAVLEDGGFVTADRTGKVRRWDASGQRVWEAKMRGRILATTPDGSLILAGGHILSGVRGDLKAVAQAGHDIEAVAAFSGDALYIAAAGEVKVFSVTGL